MPGQEDNFFKGKSNIFSAIDSNLFQYLLLYSKDSMLEFEVCNSNIFSAVFSDLFQSFSLRNTLEKSVFSNFKREIILVVSYKSLAFVAKSALT